jgi:hypothetical protein
VDFVLAPGPERTAYLEAKYARRVDGGDAAPLAKVGGGIVLTRDRTGDLADGRVDAVPAAEFLALIEAPALAPSRR